MNIPIQFYGHDIGPDVRLCHPPKEGVLLWCPPAAADFDHVRLFPLRLQPSTCGPPTSYSRFNRSVIMSQKLCRSVLLGTGPASTPNASREFHGFSPSRIKELFAGALFPIARAPLGGIIGRSR